MEKTYFVYLGGNHEDSDNWRDEFDSIAKKKLFDKSYSLKGIDPFDRTIDEHNVNQIVERDVFILAHNDLAYIVMKSSSVGSVLSTGTAFESMIAKYLGKPLIVIGVPDKNKYRRDGDEQLSGWLHPFVKYFSDVIVSDIEKAIEWIIDSIDKNYESQLAVNTIERIKKNFSFNYPDSNPFQL